MRTASGAPPPAARGSQPLGEAAPPSRGRTSAIVSDSALSTVRGPRAPASARWTIVSTAPAGHRRGGRRSAGVAWTSGTDRAAAVRRHLLRPQTARSAGRRGEHQRARVRRGGRRRGAGRAPRRGLPALRRPRNAAARGLLPQQGGLHREDSRGVPSTGGSSPAPLCPGGGAAATARAPRRGGTRARPRGGVGGATRKGASRLTFGLHKRGGVAASGGFGRLGRSARSDLHGRWGSRAPKAPAVPQASPGVRGPRVWERRGALGHPAPGRGPRCGQWKMMPPSTTYIWPVT